MDEFDGRADAKAEALITRRLASVAMIMAANMFLVCPKSNKIRQYCPVQPEVENQRLWQINRKWCALFFIRNRCIVLRDPNNMIICVGSILHFRLQAEMNVFQSTHAYYCRHF